MWLKLTYYFELGLVPLQCIYFCFNDIYNTRWTPAKKNEQLHFQSAITTVCMINVHVLTFFLYTHVYEKGGILKGEKGLLTSMQSCGFLCLE